MRYSLKLFKKLENLRRICEIMNAEKLQAILDKYVGAENTAELREDLIDELVDILENVPYQIVCDSSNNNEEDSLDNRINVDICFMCPVLKTAEDQSEYEKSNIYQS